MPLSHVQWYCWDGNISSKQVLLQHYLSGHGSLCFYLTATMVAGHTSEAGCLVLCRSGRVLEKSIVPAVSCRLVGEGDLILFWEPHLECQHGAPIVKAVI